MIRMKVKHEMQAKLKLCMFGINMADSLPKVFKTIKYNPPLHIQILAAINIYDVSLAELDQCTKYFLTNPYGGKIFQGVLNVIIIITNLLKSSNQTPSFSV